MNIFKGSKSKKSQDDEIPLFTDEKPVKKGIKPTTVIRWMWILFIALGGAIAIFMLLIYNGVIGYMPPIEELEDPHDKLASVVYASDGTTELGRYFAGAGNRVYTDYDALSPYVIDALIATEDARFESHSGIDFTNYVSGRLRAQSEK